jgi:signal transduction histidine kinase
MPPHSSPDSIGIILVFAILLGSIFLLWRAWRGAAKAKKDAIAAHEAAARDIERVIQEKTIIETDLRRTIQRNAELQETLNRALNINRRFCHDIPKRVNAICRALRADEASDEVRDLKLAIEKVKLHLTLSGQSEGDEAIALFDKNAMDAGGDSALRYLRYLARILDEEQRAVFDFQGDERLGMAHKLVLWDVMLSNILSNAIWHLRQGGRIRIAVEQQSNGLGRIDITNEGSHIPKKLLHRVFDVGVTNKPGGRGLGLHIAQEAAEEMRAKIQLPSNVGGFLRKRRVRFSIVDLPMVKV